MGVFEEFDELFERDFGVLDWDTAGARYTTDGSGSQNFKGNFSDMMNGSSLSSIKWFNHVDANTSITAVTGKSIRLAGSGASTGHSCWIKTKRILGSLSHNGVMTFRLNILGTTKGGWGMLISVSTGKAARMGFYRDENNYMLIENNNDDANDFHIRTKKEGTETIGAWFNIPASDPADQLIEIVCEDGLVQVLINGIFAQSNTTNIPITQDMRAYVEVVDEGASDDYIDIDYIKVEI